MPKNRPFKYIIILAMITVIIAGSIFFVIPKKEVASKFQCTCVIPDIGEKNLSLVVSGDGLPSGVLEPAGLTLKVYNQSVACSCETKIGLIKR